MLDFAAAKSYVIKAPGSVSLDMSFPDVGEVAVSFSTTWHGFMSCAETVYSKESITRVHLNFLSLARAGSSPVSTCY